MADWDASVSDDDVSDVNPDELKQMLEGLSDNDDYGADKKLVPQVVSKTPNVNLKSSLKTNGSSDAQRKVKFTQDTKEDDDLLGDLDDLLAEKESSQPGNKPTTSSKSGKSQLEATATATGSTSLSTPPSGSAPASTPATPAASATSQQNRSKVMRDLFGLNDNKKSEKPQQSTKGGGDNKQPSGGLTTTSKPPASKPSKPLQKPIEDDDDDDLFAGLDGGPNSSSNKNTSSALSASKTGSSSRPSSGFMADLFGSGKSSNNNIIGESVSDNLGPKPSKKTVDSFTLDDKYKSGNFQAQAPTQETQNRKPDTTGTGTQQSSENMNTGGRRRGRPTVGGGEAAATSNTLGLGSNDDIFSIGLTTPAQPQPQPQPPPPQPQPSQVQQQPPPQPSFLSTSVSAPPAATQPSFQSQQPQQPRFQPTPAQHYQQQPLAPGEDFQTVMEDNKAHLKIMLERQTNAIKETMRQQQMQSETLLQQLESEIKLKGELARNHLKIMSDLQVPPSHMWMPYGGHEGGGMIGLDPTNIKSDPAAIFKEREERIRESHADEIKTYQAKIHQLTERAKVVAQEHQDELDLERKRRVKELQEQSEDHKITVETIRRDYMVLVDRIKELKDLESDAAIEARDSSKAIDLLLQQVTTNMTDVAGLQDRIEDKMSKAVDIKEALLKKKDDQLQVLQSQLIAKGQENQEEQKHLRETIDELRKDINEKEADLRAREMALQRQRESFQATKRKQELEVEISLSQIQDQKARLKEQMSSLQEERRALHEAVEREHKQIVAEKARQTMRQKLGQTAEIGSDGKPTRSTKATSKKAKNDHATGVDQVQVNAMSAVVEEEREKVREQWDRIANAKARLQEKSAGLREDRKSIEAAIKKMAAVDREVSRRIDELSEVAQLCARTKQDCQEKFRACKAIEAERERMIGEAKGEAVKRLEAVEREVQRLEAIRVAASKERRRLLHTRQTVMCSRCTNPLSDAFESRELSNLGLRTAGDGATLSSSLHLANLRNDAIRDQEFLDKEAQYLKSLISMN